MGYNKNYYDNNKAKVLEKNRKYYQEHKTEINNKLKLKNKEQRDRKRLALVLTCPVCGTTFTPQKRIDQIYCCEKCAMKAAAKKLRESGYFESEKYKLRQKERYNIQKLKKEEQKQNIAE